jgi:uncharacterized protein (DUF433 family)
MVLAGAPTYEIREDYPTLSEDDVTFAAFYAGIGPAPDDPIEPI